MRQTRSFYARANSIVRKFSSSFQSTKLLLFKAFCTPIYGCSLWCCMFQYSLNKLRVAYNDAFSLLLNEPRWCSASRLFGLHNVPSFSAIIRKSIHALWCNLKNCDNILVQAFLLSDICMLSLLFNSWRNSIFSICYVYITRLFIIVFHGLRACY